MCLWCQKGETYTHIDDGVGEYLLLHKCADRLQAGAHQTRSGPLQNTGLLWSSKLASSVDDCIGHKYFDLQGRREGGATCAGGTPFPRLSPTRRSQTDANPRSLRYRTRLCSFAWIFSWRRSHPRRYLRVPYPCPGAHRKSPCQNRRALCGRC